MRQETEMKTRVTPIETHDKEPVQTQITHTARHVAQ